MSRPRRKTKWYQNQILVPVECDLFPSRLNISGKGDKVKKGRSYLLGGTLSHEKTN